MPVIIPVIPFTSRRKRPVVPPNVATGPVLIAATYDAVNFSLALTFDRAVNVVGGFLVGETITVLDGPNEALILNTPDAEGAGTATLTILMFANDTWVGEGVTMSAGAGTGIVGADNAEPWSGVSNLELPFP